MTCIISVLAINFGFILMVNERLAEMLVYTAGQDWLTGEMNRRNIVRVAEASKLKALKFRQSQSILLMNLDPFKQFKDTLGHLFGDTLIQTLGGEHIYFTESIGVCDSNQGRKDFKGMFSSVDQVVYMAKKAG